MRSDSYRSIIHDWEIGGHVYMEWWGRGECWVVETWRELEATGSFNAQKDIIPYPTLLCCVRELSEPMLGVWMKRVSVWVWGWFVLSDIEQVKVLSERD